MNESPSFQATQTSSIFEPFPLTTLATNSTTSVNITNDIAGTANIGRYIPYEGRITTVVPGNITIPAQTTNPYGHNYLLDGTVITTYGIKFNCYASTNGRMSEKYKIMIFGMFEKSKLDYNGYLKHLSISNALFNTVVLEYAIKFKTNIYMELVSKNQKFSETELFNEVIGQIR